MCRNLHITACNWVFVLTFPLKWNQAVTFRELVIHFPRALHRVLLSLPASTHTSHPSRAAVVSKRSPHCLFPLGKNRRVLRTFLIFSPWQGQGQEVRETMKLPLNSMSSFILQSYSSNNAVFGTYEVPVMCQVLFCNVYTHWLKCSEWPYKTGSVLTLQMNWAQR